MRLVWIHYGGRVFSAAMWTHLLDEDFTTFWDGVKVRWEPWSCP